MYKVKIASIDEFRDSQKQWNELVLAMKRPSVFCTWEWIYTWWEHFGKFYNLLIIFVYKGNELVGVFPIALSNMTIEDGLIPGRVLSYCSSLELYPDQLDIICSEEDSEYILEAIFRFLTRDYTKWDIFHLSHLLNESHILRWLYKLNMSYDIQKVSASPYILLVNGFDEYMKRFSKKQRHNMNRLKNRLYREYNVQFKIYSNNNNAEIESILKELFRLHHLRKRQTNIKTTFATHSVEDFHKNLSERLGKTEWLRLGSLITADKAIAIGYGFAFGNYFGYYQSGFDPAWERHSIGSTLILELIENAYKEGFAEFDFLRGDEKYKSAWTNENRGLFNANIYNKTLRGAAIKATFSARGLVKKLSANMRIKELLQKINNARKKPAFLIIKAILERLPFRPIRIEFYYRLQYKGIPEPIFRTNTINIRIGSENDIEKLVQCEDKRDIFLNRFKCGDYCIVATIDGQIAGYEWFCVKSKHIEERYGYEISIPDNAIYAYDAFILPNYRRKGIWSQLIAASSDLMNKYARDTIISHVDCGNEISIDAHKKFGFTPIKRLIYFQIAGLEFVRSKDIESV